MSSTGNLTLVTNDKFKRSFKTSCTVKMGDQVDHFTDFIAFGYDKNSSPVMVKNADALTLGQAYMMVGIAFKEMLAELEPSMQKEILDYLEGAL